MTVTQQRRPVPAANKPTITPRRAGRHWTLKLGSKVTYGSPQMADMPLHRGLVAVTWTGGRGVIQCTTETWNEVGVRSVWADEVDDMKREAKEVMPQTVMRDVSVSALHRGHAVVQPGHSVPTADVGITALAREVQRLVTDMASYDKPTPDVQAEFARRYGKYRDAMTRLRQEFLEAEGAFETAQAMLIGFMGDDDA